MCFSIELNMRKVIKMIRNEHSNETEKNNNCFQRMKEGKKKRSNTTNNNNNKTWNKINEIDDKDTFECVLFCVTPEWNILRSKYFSEFDKIHLREQIGKNTPNERLTRKGKQKHKINKTSK